MTRFVLGDPLFPTGNNDLDLFAEDLRQAAI